MPARDPAAGVDPVSMKPFAGNLLRAPGTKYVVSLTITFAGLAISVSLTIKKHATAPQLTEIPDSL